ncbi:MAG: HAMP domain-containing histidine kinase, partial [Bdellovibrionales bacterium]|nr:HAMP domain-containing histidine kinase [Bdellovibrionales bacterium]
MLFSSKITNSVLTFLERKNLDLEELHSLTGIPDEFLRDPSSWLSASEVENFLRTSERLFSYLLKDELQDDTFVTKVGHSCAELHSWSDLDVVLKMMPGPRELYAQPGRFISYFVSPDPIISVLEKESSSESFQLSLSSEEYPLTITYLVSALEALPTYVGRPMAEVSWKGQEVQIRWSDDQDSLLEEKDLAPVVNPELLKTLVQSLEKNQKELEKKNRELLEKNKALLDAQRRLKKQMNERIFTEKLSGLKELANSVAHEIRNPVLYSTNQVQRLKDYFARAQQLITIIVGKDRETPQVREAMRRMDWELVRSQFDSTVGEAMNGLERVGEIVKDLAYLAGQSVANEDEKVETDLNSVVANAVKMIGPQKPSNVRIDTHLFLDRKIRAYPVRLEQAVLNLVTNAIHSIPGTGVVRISTRPKGKKAEIEIADTGLGLNQEEIDGFLSDSADSKKMNVGLSIAHSIVEMHEGRIDISSRPG